MYKLIRYINIAFMPVFILHNAWASVDIARISLESLSQQAIKYKAFPGFCLQVGDRAGVLMTRCYGSFTYKNKHKDTPNDAFDLASLTKVVATSADIMKLYEQGKIKLTDKASKYIPQQHTNVTIEELLDHSSGLPPEVSLPTTWQKILSTQPEHMPGTHYKYSDINFLWLEKIIENVSGESFYLFTQQQVFHPLHMQHTAFNPLKTVLKSHIVPTQLDGVVDDPLARDLGGIAGNAGVFSTINDMGIYARVLLNHGKYHDHQWIKSNVLKLFTTRDLQIKDSTRALGFDTVYNPAIITPQPHQFSAGQYIDPNAFGHTGYTGTAMWVSPKDNLYMVFLSNRVNGVHQNLPRRDRYWRQRIANWVWRHFAHYHKNQTFSEIER